MDYTEMACEACRAGAPPASDSELEKFLQQSPDWQRLVIDDEPRLRRVYRFSNFALALAFTNAVGEMAEAIHEWRTLYPVSGIRSTLTPPPGWRAPRDWATYPVPIASLQPETAPGMAPPSVLPFLDWMHGESGRLIYDCEPYSLLGGGLCK